ncbi:MAG TPA: methyl-accepting chemotaxis protein, partial [Rhodocyclaceae bacterium]|nr:methyl-accepting chemotaxis protein [Rhodocyclaceae bacterium]
GIGYQLAMAFTVIVGLFVVVAGWTVFSLGRVNAAAERIATVSLAKDRQIAILTYAYGAMRESVRNNIIFTDPEVMKGEAARYDREKANFFEALSALEKIAADHAAPGEVELLKRLRQQATGAIAIQDKAMAEAMQFLSAVAMGILQQQAAAPMKVLEDSLGEARGLVQAQNRERAGDIVDESARTSRLAMLLAAAAALAACVLGFLFAAGVRKPLEATARLMESVAAGDLTQRIEPEGCAEIQRVQNAAMKTTQTLAGILGAIRKDAGDLKGAATALAGSADGVRGGSENQSQAAATMAGILQDMASRMNHIAALGQQAQDLSCKAGQQAAGGCDTIQTMVDEIRKMADLVTDSAATAISLGRESERISAITAVIHDLADQTNLLALNAAIEAARAGESGRGFAVVADEVRKLAEKTTASASEIAAMVSAIQNGARDLADQMQRSVGRVDEGLRMACAAGESMGVIESSSRQVAKVIDEVSQALREQSSGGEEIATSVEHIVHMIDENNRSTISMAATAQQLDRLATVLDSNIARFRTA